MKILSTGETITPEFFDELDRSKNIIICMPTKVNNIIELTENVDIYNIITEVDNLLTKESKINDNIISFNSNINLKISVPAGIKININLPGSYNDHINDIYIKLYKKFDVSYSYASIDPDKLSHIIFENFKFENYVDLIALRNNYNKLLIKKYTPIAELYFSWYIQTHCPVPMIENIYVINDNYTFENFNQVI